MNVWECRVEAAMKIIERYGGIDGDHHKDWIIDQIARVLKAHHYEKWVEEMTSGNNEGHDWDTGIPP